MNNIEPEIRLHNSLAVRLLLASFGVFFVVVGVIGIFLPVLPTTPFILLAAACFARSSHRFYRWLTRNRIFGPAISDWQKYHCISLRTKRFASVLITLMFTISIVFFVPLIYAKFAMALIAALLLAWIWRIPTCHLQVGN